ncbi:dynamin-like 120 kDa protein, mitochondrial isoform X3 [Bacillus rossius redtenbacheri]|uniref:dynamin-like 120 kDa protein, mitochondrial isoform X3 n=1 Tax=Bacillus rossius redtenbacheri TaxID=93214 RepID=UPI002FDCF93C
MAQVVRGKFGCVVVVLGHGRYAACPAWVGSRQRRAPLPAARPLAHWSGARPRLLLQDLRPLTPLGAAPRRGVAMLVARLLRGVLKIRYLVLGGALGGGVTLQRTYERWKEAMPDVSWLEEFFPDVERLDSLRSSLMAAKERIKDSMQLDPRLKALGADKYQSFRDWFDRRLDDAIQAAETNELDSTVTNEQPMGVRLNAVAYARPVGAEKPGEDGKGAGRDREQQARLEQVQEDAMRVQLQYQRELERLERENKDLRKQLLLRDARRPAKAAKKSLIDMYSEVLDELSGYDRAYSVQDQLPRVVVVGDQSSGKTSVLEMIARARIFPRGAGEMMTRAPVKVTLSEGPYHVAQFRDSSREFDLAKEADLAELRREVELRMKNSVRSGKTVSSDVISMSVKGPGLQRMVLVDLPGIISTVTVDMAEDTREAIRQMTQQHMSNPNAIILCIQDGSVDAERSNVTDLVAQMDPHGRRTIFVLTKVDLAEESLANPDRIKKILSGKLFPMKALGYFAVVTGRGRKEDSIQTIQEYEEKFFRSSKLFKDGMIMSGQVTTRNLSLAVSECFWKMVRETVEQQADAFKATRFNLETEWKNTFPRLRELDRDELFEKARGEILDEVINMSQVSPRDWEELLMSKLWDKVSAYVFEHIYLPAAHTGSAGTFNTTVDIRLRQWAEQQLPQRSVECGWEALRQRFLSFLESARQSRDHDPIFDALKAAVVDEAMRRHAWEDKAPEMLRVIQLNTLEDRSIAEKQHWDAAVKFLETSVKDKLQQTEAVLREMMGPGLQERWLRWSYRTPEQHKRCAVRAEIDKLLVYNTKHTSSLSHDELTTMRKNLQRAEVDVDNEFIRETWHLLYRRHFLQQSLLRAYDCRKAYYMYHQGHETEIECADVVLFWRIQQMLKVTSNALRQQIMNREARRLEKEIKEVLDDYSQDAERKEQLLTGRRVTLAEELKRVRQIQEKLEEFIQALNKEK